MRQIRPVSQDLSPAFLALSAQYLPGTAPETLRALLQSQPQLCLCLLLEGRLQGVCYGGPSPFGPGLLGLEGIAVAADFQNRGHGSALLAAFEAAGLEMISAELNQVPQTTMEVDLETARKLLRFIELLEDNDDVQNVWHNWDQEE